MITSNAKFPMKNIELGDYGNIAYRKFEDINITVKNNSTNHKKSNLNRSLTPLIGNKIADTKSPKFQLKVKMPKVKEERPYLSNPIKPIPPMRNISITPSKLLEKVQFVNYSPPGLLPKTIISHKSTSKKNRLNLLPEIKGSDSSNRSFQPDGNNIYSELLGFLIKVQVEYLPIYQKIDVQRKGRIDFLDFEAFIYKFHANVSPQEGYNRLIQLNILISSDCVIWKKNFLAICTGLQHNKPTAKDFKSIFLDSPMEILVKKLKGHVKMFREFTDINYLELNTISAHINPSEDKLQKSLKIVFSEPVDIPRFISCLPFFRYVKNIKF